MKRPGLRDATQQRFFWPIVSTMLGVLVVILIVVNSTARGKVLAYEIREGTLTRQLEDLRASVRKCLEELEAAPRLSSIDLERLMDSGLSDPISDLKTDLFGHPELIPYKGSLGGSMMFYSEDRIWILTDRWAAAEFDDGHRMGYILLSYTVKDGRIAWRVKEHYLM